MGGASMVFMGVATSLADDRHLAVPARARRAARRARRDAGAVDALPADRAALDADAGARHVHDRHIARRRRCAAGHVCDAGQRRSPPPSSTRCSSSGFDLGLDGAAISTVLVRVRDARDRHSRRACRAPADPAARPGTAWASRAAVLLDRPSGRADPDRHAGRQRLCDHRDGRLRRRGRCRLGDHRPHRPGRLRRHLRPFRRGRPDPRRRTSARADTTAWSRPCATA